LIKPQTEADPAALMFQFLTAAGNALGNNAWAQVERSRHYPNLFSLIVGATAKARKGTSARWVACVLAEAAPDWEAESGRPRHEG
jgi:hypothetical protein